MPLSSRLAPCFARLRYTGVTRPHTMVIPMLPSSPLVAGVEPTIKTTDDSDVDFSTAVFAFVGDILAESFAPTTQFGFAEIYAVDPDTGLRTFIWMTNIDLPGASEDPQVGLVENVWVFKTTAGKPLKVYAMEGVYNPDVRDIGSLPADGRKVLADWIVSGDNFFYGRRDAWPLAFISSTSKENDVLRRNSIVTT